MVKQQNPLDSLPPSTDCGRNQIIKERSDDTIQKEKRNIIIIKHKEQQQQQKPGEWREAALARARSAKGKVRGGGGNDRPIGLPAAKSLRSGILLNAQIEIYRKKKKKKKKSRPQKSPPPLHTLKKKTN